MRYILLLILFLSFSCSHSQHASRGPSNFGTRKNCQQLRFPLNFECFPLRKTITERRVLVSEFRKKLSELSTQENPVNMRHMNLQSMFNTHASGELKDFLMNKLDRLHQNNLIYREGFIESFGEELHSLDKYYDVLEEELSKFEKYLDSNDPRIVSMATKEFGLALSEIRLQFRRNDYLPNKNCSYTFHSHNYISSLFEADTSESFLEILNTRFPGSYSGNWEAYLDMSPLFFESTHKSQIEVFFRLGELTPKLIQRVEKVIPINKLSVRYREYPSKKAIRVFKKGGVINYGYSSISHRGYSQKTFKKLNLVDFLEGIAPKPDDINHFNHGCLTKDFNKPKCSKSEWIIND